ncbi:MAG: TolC family protein, partial [Muribaculaceae bacterium]|nr:TolC family protein [Muribaculaceae bacterium]
MKHILLIVIIVTCIFNANSMTYDEILSTIANNNPSLASNKAIGNAEIMSMKSNNNLPDPEIGFEHKWGGGGTKWGVGVSQSFEWPQIYSTRKNAINSTSEAIDYQNKVNRLNKIIEIKLILIDIVNARKQLALFNRLDSQMDSLAAKYELGRKRGEVTKLDINKIKIEKISITREIKSLNNQLQDLEASLLNENGGKDISGILASLNNYPDEIILSEENYVQLIHENDPQLTQFSLMTKSQEQNAKVIEMSKRPGFSVGYKLENELGTYFNGFSVGVSIPLFSHKYKSDANIANREAIRLQSEEYEIEQIANLKSQRANALALFQELEEYRPTLQNQDNIGLLKKALDGGQINLITYIQEINFFIEAQKNYLNVEY